MLPHFLVKLEHFWEELRSSDEDFELEELHFVEQLLEKFEFLCEKLRSNGDFVAEHLVEALLIKEFLDEEDVEA